MPFCTQCAWAVPEGARFCPNCGARVPELVHSGATTETTPASTVALPPASGSEHGRFEPGTRLGARYRIVALLGHGGMGEVYRADDLQLGQSVALKFLVAEKAARPGMLTQFRGEVRTARLIAHPNVCRVYDIGEADGHVFLSMEYIDGEDLASVLRRLGRLTPDKAVEIARQICLGLAAAHEAGMLHRDLKPANVMIDGRGRARITDFGLAGFAVELARDGQAAGTPAYMAPEQLAEGRVSARSDVYSLGLVLYELFTGKRAFEARNLSELRRMHESGSITSPSDLARGIDPAVERVIMHCLERDPNARPPSAYAVLAGLPGGDPLAAALAAGETPSPELVANSGDRGTLSPRVAAAWILAGLAGLGLWSGIMGPEFRPMTQPTSVLSVRANDLLLRTGAFTTLPSHSAEGFAFNGPELAHQRSDSLRAGVNYSVYYWRRWSPRTIETRGIHRVIVQADDPPMGAAGEAAILLDPQGRLIGLRAIPPDTAAVVSGGTPPWALMWSAAGLDSAAFRPTSRVAPMMAMCDTVSAWTGPLATGENVTLQAGASHGRLVQFTMIHPWGASTAPLDTAGADPFESLGWLGFAVAVLPFMASIYFGSRNIRLGRGDWRGATRLAAFVVVMNLLVGVWNQRLAEDGLIGAALDLFDGRTLGHALIHGFELWFAYMALEPYVRRLWPRMLVSWTRLISGRWRDPLVGRDVLIGAVFGATSTTFALVFGVVGARLSWFKVPALLPPDALISLGSLSRTACELAYAGSICLISMLDALVMVLVLRLVTRRTWIAVAIASILVIAFNAAGTAPVFGWPTAILVGVVSAFPILVLMRWGLLACVLTAFVGSVVTSTVATLDLSAWYADRALAPLLLIVLLLVYGTVIALAGRPILGDPLRDEAAR
jgi:serine/threonine-protein kinase